MTKKNVLLGLVFICFWSLVCVTFVSADLPIPPNYYYVTVQGRLTDSSGAAVANQQINSFTLKQTGYPGSIPVTVNVVPATQNIITDSKGVFNAVLDLSSKVGQPGSINQFARLNNQLDLVISTNVGTFTQPFASAPYAIRSKYADSADTATNNVLRAGDTMTGGLTLSQTGGGATYDMDKINFVLKDADNNFSWVASLRAGTNDLLFYGADSSGTTTTWVNPLRLKKSGNISVQGLLDATGAGTVISGTCVDTVAGVGVKGSSSYGIGVFGFSNSPLVNDAIPANTAGVQGQGLVGVKGIAGGNLQYSTDYHFGVQGICDGPNDTGSSAIMGQASNKAYSGVFKGGKGVEITATDTALKVKGNNAIIGIGYSFDANVSPVGVAGKGGSKGVGVYGETSASDNYAGWFKNTKGKDFPGIQVDGYIKSSGTVRAPNVDFAEWIKVSDQTISAGDVLVIDPAMIESLKKSNEPFSTLVAGIVSTKPAFVGGYYIKEKNQTIDLSNEEMEKNGYKMLSLAGRVPCNVSTENGPIEIGDLLTTSSTPGYAMKVTDKMKAMGAIVGKALEPLKEGKGKIIVLITLQ